MSEKPSVPDEQIVWQAKTSKDGMPYRIGHAKKPQDGLVNIDNTVTVDWPVSNKWVDTSQEVRTRVFIYSYNLEDGGYFFTYRLNVDCQAQGKYTFWDGTGDTYSLAVELVGNNHYVDYNSRDPTIRQVRFVSWV